MYRHSTMAQAQFRVLHRLKYCSQAVAKEMEVLVCCSQILEAGIFEGTSIGKKVRFTNCPLQAVLNRDQEFTFVVS
jgi:hypothetical protein